MTKQVMSFILAASIAFSNTSMAESKVESGLSEGTQLAMDVAENLFYVRQLQAYIAEQKEMIQIYEDDATLNTYAKSMAVAAIVATAAAAGFALKSRASSGWGEVLDLVIAITSGGVAVGTAWEWYWYGGKNWLKAMDSKSEADAALEKAEGQLVELSSALIDRLQQLQELDPQLKEKLVTLVKSPTYSVERFAKLKMELNKLQREETTQNVVTFNSSIATLGTLFFVLKSNTQKNVVFKWGKRHLMQAVALALVGYWETKNIKELVEIKKNIAAYEQELTFAEREYRDTLAATVSLELL